VSSTLPSVLMAKLQSKKIDNHPLSWLEFQEDCIMTACKDGKCLTAPCWDVRDPQQTYRLRVCDASRAKPIGPSISNLRDFTLG
jgi:hypothetical protein